MNVKRLAAAVIAAVLTAVVAGCGSENDSSESAATATRTAAATPAQANDSEEQDKDEDAGEEEGGATRDCDEVGELDRKPKHKLPHSVPLVSGARVYESQGPFGKTTRYFAVTTGDREALAKVRDKVDAKLERAGYKVLDTDQEEGAEAEGHLTGPHTVDVQVINLCKGKLRIRYTVS